MGVRINFESSDNIFLEIIPNCINMYVSQSLLPGVEAGFKCNFLNLVNRLYYSIVKIVKILRRVLVAIRLPSFVMTHRPAKSLILCPDFSTSGTESRLYLNVGKKIAPYISLILYQHVRRCSQIHVSLQLRMTYLPCQHGKDSF